VTAVDAVVIAAALMTAALLAYALVAPWARAVGQFPY